jgi:hypothetical protein
VIERGIRTGLVQARCMHGFVNSLWIKPLFKFQNQKLSNPLKLQKEERFFMLVYAKSDGKPPNLRLPKLRK